MYKYLWKIKMPDRSQFSQNLPNFMCHIIQVCFDWRCKYWLQKFSVCYWRPAAASITCDLPLRSIPTDARQWLKRLVVLQDQHLNVSIRMQWMLCIHERVWNIRSLFAGMWKASLTDTRKKWFPEIDDQLLQKQCNMNFIKCLQNRKWNWFQTVPFQPFPGRVYIYDYRDQ